MRTRIDTIFLDDGGVMNNNALRGPEWQRLIAEFFVPRLGGETESWKKANVAIIGSLLAMIEAGPQEQDYDAWFTSYLLFWLRRMAAQVGVATPEEDEECIRLTWQASDYITSRVHSGYPGAAEAIRSLHDMEFTLFTASGEHSRELDGYLSGMGVRQYFERLYGTDLIKTVKNSPEYYRRLFEHSGVNPGHSLIVDDNPQCLAWAKSFRANTCLVGAAPENAAKADFTIASLADLPSILGGSN